MENIERYPIWKKKKTFLFAVLLVLGGPGSSLLAGQGELKNNSISLSLLQFQSNVFSSVFVLDPVFILGVGYERLVQPKFGLTGYFSSKFGGVEARTSNDWSATADVVEWNFKLGLIKYVSLSENMALAVKFQIFHEQYIYSNNDQGFYPAGASWDFLTFRNRYYQGIEFNMGLNIRISGRMRLFGNTGIQFGDYESMDAKYPNRRIGIAANIPILEQLGIKYEF